MALIPYETARAFLRGEAHRTGQFVSTGGALLSYAMPLAHRAPDGAIVLDYTPRSEGGATVSRTTNRHMMALEAVLSWESVPYTVEAQPVPKVETGGKAYLR